MHNGNWNYDMGGGNWWWMAIMMIAFWGGIIWIAVTLIRHGNHTSHAPAHMPVASPPARPTPQELLAERLARGEIEPDDYRNRLDALQHRQTP